MVGTFSTLFRRGTEIILRDWIQHAPLNIRIIFTPISKSTTDNYSEVARSIRQLLWIPPSTVELFDVVILTNYSYILGVQYILQYHTIIYPTETLVPHQGRIPKPKPIQFSIGKPIIGFPTSCYIISSTISNWNTCDTDFAPRLRVNPKTEKTSNPMWIYSNCGGLVFPREIVTLWSTPSSCKATGKEEEHR